MTKHTRYYAVELLYLQYNSSIKNFTVMLRYIFLVVFIASPGLMFGVDDRSDTLTIKPIGVDYSKYSGNNKLYIVGECEGMKGNQIVVFQNRPSFDFFENDETYKEEQKVLEKEIWNVILEKDSMIVKGVWHEYHDRRVFLCHKIIKMKKPAQIN